MFIFKHYFCKTGSFEYFKRIGGDFFLMVIFIDSLFIHFTMMEGNVSFMTRFKVLHNFHYRMKSD